MRNYLLLILFGLLSFGAQAQDYEGGIMFGPSSYQGDIADGPVEIKETNLALGLFMRRYLTNRWSIRGNLYIAKLSGDDRHAKAFRDLRFRTDIYELSMMGEWHLFNRERFSSTGKRDNAFDLYFYAGVGLSYFDPSSSGPGLPEGESFSNFILAFPIGGGLKYDLFERTAVGLDSGVRYTTTDYLDGVSKLANPSSNDYYVFLTVNISILIDY